MHQQNNTGGAERRGHGPLPTSPLSRTTKNHLVDWEGIKVVERGVGSRESHRRRRHVKEAMWIRKIKAAINRDEGNYELPHLYDDVIRPVRH